MDERPSGGQPSLIVGLDTFERCVKSAEHVGKWNAWRAYYTTYEDVFRTMLRYVYQCNLEDLRPHVEALDFATAMESGRRFVASGGVERVGTILRGCMHALPAADAFNVYLLVGLGHAQGMALPADPPYIYLGLEACHGTEGLDGLLAHEYNHLVRGAAVHRGSEALVLRLNDWVIAEGLATVFSLVHLGIEPTASRLMSTLPALPQDALSKVEEIETELRSHWECEMTQELVKRYVATPWVYLIGGLWIARLLKQGYDIRNLTRMPTDTVSDLIFD